MLLYATYSVNSVFTFENDMPTIEKVQDLKVDVGVWSEF